MRQLLLFIFLSIASLVAASDYFDILQDEFKQTTTGKVRRYYMTIEEEVWDYYNETNSKVSEGNHFIGTRYYKALYHEYEDITFTKKKEKFHWQGNMGPILKAEVGDIIQIFFWNRASKNFTIHPHGIFYEFEMEGAVFKDAYQESSVGPNQNYTYTWSVLPRAGPGPKDGDSLVWGYHSHVTENDIYAGLYGAILVYRQGKLSPFNNDIVTALFVADENLSPYLSQTMSELYPDFDISNYDQDKVYKAHQFPSINGLISSSPKDLVFNETVVQWHLLGWGSYMDVEFIKWENATIIDGNNPTAMINNYVRLMPASFYSVILKLEEIQGEYQFGSLDNQNGMTMKYKMTL
ncbi:Cupredoxin [Cokeromyces recurvatus]|uniref:Cupredoxin n=1 Tax=Cokeromyces recurvatus TaxID=90255 RepID=UPI0022200920|nr:Cupredoxin [Cokeromyces recurvatus]KAI7904549.1 Cupredoxin [Cokeromyces recurvatus]